MLSCQGIFPFPPMHSKSWLVGHKGGDSKVLKLGGIEFPGLKIFKGGGDCPLSYVYYTSRTSESQKKIKRSLPPDTSTYPHISITLEE